MRNAKQLDIGRKPAPGELVYVQGFINTYNLEAGRDELGTPESLRAWLARHGFLAEDGRVSGVDVERAAAVREALRALALANNGGTWTLAL